MKFSKTELNDIIENFKAVALENYVSNELAEAKNTSDIATVFGNLLSQVSAVKIGMIGGGFPWVSDALDDVLAGMQYEVDRDSVQYRELCRQLSQITIDHMRHEKDRLRGKYPELDLNRMFQEQLGNEGAKPEPGIALSELIDLYEKENVRAGNWQVRTIPEYQSIFRNIIRLLGDQPVNEISKEVCQQFKQNLMGLPKNYFRATKKYSGIPIDRVVSEAESPLLNIKTVNKYLDRLSWVLRFGVNNGHLVANHADGLRIKQKKIKAHKERDAFSNEDLTTLFHSSAYLEDTHDPPWKFWLPLLGLYTGARLEELCQLPLSAIEEIEGIWAINIKSDTEAGTRVKTESSDNRYVPLHPFLVDDLKFIRFVERVKGKRLFPELKKQSERYGHYPSRWFGTYRKNLGITSGKKAFHSFRHTFQDNLKQQLIAESVIDELVGHSLQGESLSRYGKPYLVKVRYEEAILKLNYEVDLTHLKSSKYVVRE